MVVLEADEFRKAWDEESVHIVLGAGHQLTQRPEGVLLGVKVHQQQGRDLRHALAVANLQHNGGQFPVKLQYLPQNKSVMMLMQAYLGVEHAVGGQDMEEVLLPVVVPLPEHLVVAVGPEAVS